MDYFKKQISPPADPYGGYVRLVPDVSLLEGLEQSQQAVHLLPVFSLEQLENRTYAPGKWTVRDTLQHLLDMERVLAYRALMFARNNPTAIPGIDENAYAACAAAGHRSVDELLEEFQAQRRSTIRLFRSFSQDMMGRSGLAADRPIGVAALGFVIAGHTFHHVQLIREKYLPLLGE